MKSIVTMLALILGSGCAYAASDFNPVGFYIGASAGRSDVRTMATALNTPVAVDEHSTGWKAVIGMRPIRLVAAELTYIDFGHPNGVSYLGNDVSSGFFLHPTVRQRAPTLSGLFYLPLPVPIIDVYARVGGARLETSGTSPILCTGLCPQIIFPPVRINRTNTDFLYGAGLQAKVSALSLRLEYERINDSLGDPALLSAGLTWTF